jgi:hypothetical protein
MSVSCQKQFSITINSPAAPTDLYWTMDEVGTANRVDKVQGVILAATTSGGAGTEYLGSIGGLIGNAAHFFNGAPGGASIQQLSTSPFFNSAVAQSGTGFSWVGWFNKASISDNLEDNLFLFFGGALLPYRVSLLLYASGIIEATISDGINSEFMDWGSHWVAGAWTFFHIWFSPVDHKLRMDINNSGVPLVSFNTYTIPSTLGQTGQIYFQVASFLGGGNDTAFDEFGYKLNRILTPTEATFLYNGGAGRTWPAVNTIFS